MKRTFYLLTLLSVLSLGLQAQVQYPLNGDFEDWTTGSFAGIPYDSLVHWDTPQRLATALSVPDTVTYQTDVAQNGTSGVLMITKLVNIGGLIITEVPGSISTGAFFVNLFTQEFGVTGGAPIDCTPTEFTGYYQYLPAGVDTAQFSVWLTRWNGTSRDTVGIVSGTVDEASTSGAYEPFSFPVDVVTADAPDTALVLVTSSGVGGLDGTTLYVDNVRLSGGDCFTGLQVIQQPNNLTVTPNPATNFVNFELPGSTSLPASVIDITGKVVVQTTAQPGMNRIDMSNLTEGIYMLQVADENGRIVYTSKIEKH